jgi:Protein of unknown function (DUF4238)
MAKGTSSPSENKATLATVAADEEAERIEAAFRASPLFQELERINSEEEPSYFESQAKRQHFIPRLMLKRFGREIDGKVFIFQLDVKTGAPRRVQIEDAASRRYFYALKNEDGTRNNRLEGFFALVEQYAAPALKRFLDSPEDIADHDRATLSFFFALLDPRTPGGGTQAEQVSNASMRMLLANNLADPKVFANSYRHLFGDESDEEIETFRQRTMKMLETGEIAFSDPRGRALQLGISTASAVATVVFQMTWTLLRRPNAGFVTSDRGLAMYDSGRKYPWSGEAWGSSPEVEVTIPVSTDTCLLLHFAPLPPVLDADGADIERVNLRMYGWAGGYIYGTTQDAVAAVRRTAKRRPQTVTHPTPKHQVMLLEADPADTSIAEANERRGWPRYLVVKGVQHDYFVIGPDDNATQISARVSRLVQERAARQFGLPPGARPTGQAETMTVDPFDFG